MSKFLGFLLGVVVALAGPAVFGVLAAPGGIELNAKEMALAYGIGALIFWTVVSYFSGAGALGAFVAFGTLIYCWLWIPNRTTNFLNDVPGVTTGMIEGSRQYTLNGVVPILTVISLVYGIQLIVQSAQRRRRERAEAERLQREQETAQAQQEAEAATLYPVAGSTYPAEGGPYAGSYGNSNRFDDLFDEDPEPVRPRNQADEQTSQFPVSAPEQTAQFPGDDRPDNDAQGNDSADDTVLVPTDRDETTQVPVENDETAQAQATGPTPPQSDQEQPTVDADEQTVAASAGAEEQKPEQPAEPQPQEPVAKADAQPVAAATASAAADEQATVATPVGTGEQPTAVAPVAAAEQKPEQATEPQEPKQPAEPQSQEPEQPAEPQSQEPIAKAEADEQSSAAGTAPAGANAQPTAAPVETGEQPTVVAPVAAAEPKAAGADQDETVVAPDKAPEQVDEPRQEKKGADGGQQAMAAPVTEAKGPAASTAKEQMGQQYRERMDNPEDTGELYISAFENPTQVSIRPAGA